jgi:hypothetical protein
MPTFHVGSWLAFLRAKPSLDIKPDLTDNDLRALQRTRDEIRLAIEKQKLAAIRYQNFIQ